MKRLVRLTVAAGALASVQAIAVTPAAAGGYCGYYGYYNYYGYYGACCPRYYEVVSYYQPVVRRVTYYQVVGYRPVIARSYYRPWHR